MTCAPNGFTNGHCVQASFDMATNHMTQAGTGTPSYDAAGNVITDGITTNTYSYDAEDRMTGVTNTYGASANYVYNALGQLVEQNEWNWGGLPNMEIMYDPFDRRIADYDAHYSEWRAESFPFDGPVGAYAAAPDNTAGGLYTIFRDLLGSMRYDQNQGARARNEAVYDPWGNDWLICGGFLSFGAFDPYCTCTNWNLNPGGRPYDPSLGRWMSPRSPWQVRLVNPDNLNAHAYGGNNPINMVDSGTGYPTQPPLPGLDQVQRALNWVHQQLSASSCSTFGCYAINIGAGVAPVAAMAAPEFLPEAVGAGRTLLNLFTDESGSIPAASETGVTSAFGDLTPQEVEQIQNVVDQAGRPIHVVGSAAQGARTAGSDIDYVAPPSSLDYFNGLENQLPGIDPAHGIIPGVPNPNIGPSIPFFPRVFP